MDEKFLSDISSNIMLIKQDINFIKERFDTEKQHSDKIGKMNSSTIDDHEERLRNLEKMMYKGLGAAIVLSVMLSAAISYFMQ